MRLPWASGVDPDSSENALFRAAQFAQQRKQQAAENLLGQQRLQLDQQRLQAETARAQAEDERAKAQGRREDRLVQQQEHQQRAAGLHEVLPLLDPNSPTFNPEMGKQLAQFYGMNPQIEASRETAPPEPPAPTMPAEGPIPSAHDAMMGALSGTRTDNPTHAGQVYVDQSEGGSAHLLPPEGGGAFNFPAAQLGVSGRESSWIPDPRRGRVYVDQVENGSAHLLGPQGGDAFNADVSTLPRMPKESQWIRDPRGPADPLPIQTRAAQEAMQQQAERDQYAQQLAEAPQRQAQYHDAVQQYQMRKQFPKVTLDTGNGSLTMDTLAIHQGAESAKQNRVQTYAKLYAGQPEALRVALPMAALGVPDDKIAAAVNTLGAKGAALGEKAREFDQSDATKRRGQDMRKGRGGAGGMAPGGKAWTNEDKQLAHELDKYAETHGLSGKGNLSEKQREISQALQDATSNPNGLTQLSIMDKFIRNATGLGVRNQTLETYRQHLGGIAARGESALNQWANGREGQQAWQTVVDALRQQLSGFESEGARANEDWKRTVASNPSFARHPDLVARREAESFSGLHGWNAPGNPLTNAAAHPRNAAKGERKTLPDGTVVEKTGPNNWQVVQKP